MWVGWIRYVRVSRREDLDIVIVGNLWRRKRALAADGVLDCLASERRVTIEDNEVSCLWVEFRDDVFVIDRELARDGAVWIHDDLRGDENLSLQLQVDDRTLACFFNYDNCILTGVVFSLRVSPEFCNRVAEDFSSEGTDEEGGWS
jgi:hypothetical protein